MSIFLAVEAIVLCNSQNSGPGEKLPNDKADPRAPAGRELGPAPCSHLFAPFGSLSPPIKPSLQFAR